MSKIYERTENGVTAPVSVRDALAEVNHAMMAGKGDVREMSSGRGRHSIEYRDGRSVKLTEVDAPASIEPRQWRGTHSNFSHLHRFGSDRRALCNRRIHPAYCTENDKPTEFLSKSEVLSSEYADLHSFCPRCDAVDQ